MNDREQFISMLDRAKVRYKIKRSRGKGDQTFVIVCGRWASDSYNFKFDHDGNLCFASMFEESKKKENDQ